MLVWFFQPEGKTTQFLRPRLPLCVAAAHFMASFWSLSFLVCSTKINNMQISSKMDARTTNLPLVGSAITASQHKYTLLLFYANHH